MHILKNVTVFTLVWSAIAIGCMASSGDESDAPVGVLAQALPRADVYAPDPCSPKCAGHACGDDDGCGGICTYGSCPAGTVCGGGGVQGVCACKPTCAGKACGAPDDCGGVCAAGTCPSGEA